MIIYNSWVLLNLKKTNYFLLMKMNCYEKGFNNHNYDCIKVFKQILKLRTTLELNILISRRSTTAQFRSGILQIRIKMERYMGEPIDERIRIFCLLSELLNGFTS